MIDSFLPLSFLSGQSRFCGPPIYCPPAAGGNFVYEKSAYAEAQRSNQCI